MNIVWGVKEREEVGTHLSVGAIIFFPIVFVVSGSSGGGIGSPLLTEDFLVGNFF